MGPRTTELFTKYGGEAATSHNFDAKDLNQHPTYRNFKLCGFSRHVQITFATKWQCAKWPKKLRTSDKCHSDKIERTNQENWGEKKIADQNKINFRWSETRNRSIQINQKQFWCWSSGRRHPNETQRSRVHVEALRRNPIIIQKYMVLQVRSDRRWVS